MGKDIARRAPPAAQGALLEPDPYYQEALADVPAWFRKEMFKGISRLATFSLKGRPFGPEQEKRLADAFTDALWQGYRWEQEHDVGRLREGFRRLSLGHRKLREEHAEMFPQPFDLMDALPLREHKPESLLPAAPTGKKLTPEEKQARKAQVMARLAGMRSGARSAEEVRTAHSEKMKLEVVNRHRRQEGKEPYESVEAWHAAAAELRKEQTRRLQMLQTRERADARKQSNPEGEEVAP